MNVFVYVARLYILNLDIKIFACNNSVKLTEKGCNILLPLQVIIHFKYEALQTKEP